MIRIVAILALLAGSATVWANDSVAALAAGGIILGTSDDIVMEREELFISEDQVRVDYVFRNMSGQDIQTRVAFPVPPFQMEPDMDIGMDLESDNPMGFSLKVDGRPQGFDTEVKHRDGIVNITHHWTQRFPAGEPVSVEHVYTPAAGGEASLYLSEQTLDTYCIEIDIQDWVRRYHKPEAGLTVSTTNVHYILKTGANWKGPIGRFRLTIEKKDPKDLVSFCGSGVKKTGPRTFVMEHTDFEPDQDLFVMFLHRNRF